MKVHVDEILCTGHGRCFVLAPEVYQLDDEIGYNALRGSTIEVAEGLEDKATFGMNNCPEGAITLVSE
jgi:ferredoxin